ncbi:UNVERIFIED_CONTAM: Serine/threonine-protein kinase MHK [Sesamum radiatum]|uniref:Serine/threonine-protein kinase MHK n=1 Tax=Sesamum radiatum TaxID=300843 RepID=A0AAW2W5J0_SESRA
MERYRILAELGNGTSGSVYKAVHIETSDIVRDFLDYLSFGVWSLRKLNHPNVIKLLEIVQENNELFFIFEYMDHNLYQIMKDRQESFSEEEIRGLMYQVLQGLAHVHKHGYIHRDLKPENLLVTNNKIKIADFGLARELSSIPPYTDYVSTRWYRAPEVLLQSSFYTPAIDMWAIGAILAELFTLCPIFPGESEIDQLYKICCVLGAPDWKTFPEATNISRLVDITYSEIMPADLSDIIPNASLEAIDLIKVSMRIPRTPADAFQLNLGSEPNLELNLWNFGTAADDCFLGLTLAVNPSAPNLEVNKNQVTEEDVKIYSGLHDHSPQSVFWSLFPCDGNIITTSVESSLSLSFGSVPHPSIGVPQSAGYAMASFQPTILDRPVLAMSSPLQQGHYYL